MLASQFIEAFAEALGVEAPSEEETAALLGLAGTAAHASERTAAPISCWLAARSGLSPVAAAAVAETVLSGAGPESLSG
jgi:hypothetical protein